MSNETQPEKGKVATDPHLLNIIHEPVFTENFFNEENLIFCKICNEAWKLKYSDLNLPPPLPSTQKAKKGNYGSLGCTTYKISNLASHLTKATHQKNEKLLDSFEVGEEKENVSSNTGSLRYVFFNVSIHFNFEGLKEWKKEKKERKTQWIKR
jgi:hypothetical protein